MERSSAAASLVRRIARWYRRRGLWRSCGGDGRRATALLCRRAAFATGEHRAAAVVSSRGRTDGKLCMAVRVAAERGWR
ncbi:hypothetical protein BHM03_00047135 [Ensete ventricosum]|nr:hypothetical protein BHM03_00047135 [Ensete ventricosum]